MSQHSLRRAAAARFCSGHYQSSNRRGGIGSAHGLSLIVLLSLAIVGLGSIPPARASSCTDDTWTPTATADAPTPRTLNSAVWTGSEMIVWGGDDYPAQFIFRNTGGRYNPTTNSWNSTSLTSAPTPRLSHTAVWTGTEMIIWGGSEQNLGTGFSGPTNTGARYNPFTNTWIRMNTQNAPLARYRHTAVWTGKEMIVWGGTDLGRQFDTGAAYNPVFNTWRTITTVNAPTARDLHSAVWTGSEMIVWGGAVDSSGGRYNPETNTWTTTSLGNSPSPRGGHTAVWTGTEMIVWGGNTPPVNTGGRYNPATDSWTATSTTNVPDARYLHTAIWTGEHMIIWGGDGFGPALNNGGKYDPATDTWTATSGANAPEKRQNHTAVWSGDQMIVWGGDTLPPSGLDTGGLYCVGVPPQLSNISTRARVLTGNSVLIAGFIISGTDNKRLLLRGIGPSLAGAGVGEPLANPALELHDSTKMLASNDDWREAQETEVRASGIPPTHDLESAIVRNFAAQGSAYTAVLSGSNGSAGVGLVEVYDLNRSTNSKLLNISTRGLIDTDENVMIAGFISGGNSSFSSQVMIRGIGPSLSQFGVTDALADPMLELHDGNGMQLAVNDDWRETQSADIQNSGLAPSDDREAAILASLAPGAYTAIVRGKDNTSGVGLVEVYNLQP